MDSSIMVLAGVIMGGAISYFTNRYSVRAADSRASRTFKREYLQNKIERLRKTYAVTIDVFCLRSKAGITAEQVQSANLLLCEAILEMPVSVGEILVEDFKGPEDEWDEGRLTEALRSHIEQLESELMVE